MARSTIQWCDDTENVVAGCDPVSPGCLNCYAVKIAARMEAGLAGPAESPSPRQRAVIEQYAGTTRLTVLDDGRHVHKWTGVVGVNVGRLRDLLRSRTAKRVFIASMGDIFHKGVPRDVQLATFAVAAVKPKLTLQLVTKRAAEMLEVYRAMEDIVPPERRALPTMQPERAELLSAAAARLGVDLPRPIDPQAPWPLRNVWPIASAENQECLDERGPLLLQCRAHVHGISAEPLLGELDLGDYLFDPTRCGQCGSMERIYNRNPDNLPPLMNGPEPYVCLMGCVQTGEPGREQCGRCGGEELAPLPPLRWIIVGLESGDRARAGSIAWIRKIVKQGRDAGCPTFVKQLGSQPLDDDGTPLDLEDSSGGDPSEWPEGDWPRDFPEERGA